MANSPLTDVVMAAALLKGAHAQAFQQLCEAVRAYEIQAITEMASGNDSHEIFRAQGKVKSIQQLRKHLVECAELRDQYTRRSNNA